MITSELRDGIVWITIEGELKSEDVEREVSQWLTQTDAYKGFITDLRGMTGIPSIEEQKRMEAWREQNNSGKPHAVLGRTNAMSVLLSMYVRLTKARDTRYFMNADAAVEWVNNFS
jgi:hypothetical protein